MQRSKSGAYALRKAIPEDVRDEYERLYGQRWEAKTTLPAGTPPSEAKAKHAEFLAREESRIAAIRDRVAGRTRSLNQRDALALAGEWYRWFVAQHEDNPGEPKRWANLSFALGELLEGDEGTFDEDGQGSRSEKQSTTMPNAKKPKAPRDYPGRLTRDEYYALPSARRWLLAMRAKSDLLELWRTCSKKPCRKHRACHGGQLCYQRPIQADLKNPNLGRPGFQFSYKYPKALDEPFAVLEHLPFNPMLTPPVPRRQK